MLKNINMKSKDLNINNIFVKIAWVILTAIAVGYIVLKIIIE